MMRPNIMRIILAGICILILIGVVLMTWMLLASDDIIELKLKKGQTSVVEFENLCLIPGQQYEYNAFLESDRRSDFILYLDFNELEDKTLKHFAHARIEINGEEICDELLVNLFEGEALATKVDFSATKLVELKIVYYLPDEVGNEAQEAEALFKLNLTIDNE